jgi:hypothetical protein
MKVTPSGVPGRWELPRFAADDGTRPGTAVLVGEGALEHVVIGPYRWNIGPVLCQGHVVSASARQVKVPHNPSPSTAPAHPGPPHTTNPTRRPGIAQVFYGCGTLHILSSHSIEQGATSMRWPAIYRHN